MIEVIFTANDNKVFMAAHGSFTTIHITIGAHS